MTRIPLVAAALVAVLAAAFLCPTATAAFYANPDTDVQIVGLPEQVYAGGESFFIVVLANDQPFFDESLDEEGAVGVCLNITNGIVTAIEGSTFETNTSVGYDNITLYQDYISEWNCTLAVVRFAPTGAGDAVHINASGWIKDKDKPLFSDRYVATDSDDASSEIIDYSNLYDVSTLSELALQRKAFYNNSIEMLGAIVGDGSIDSQVNMAWFGAIMWTESLSYTLLTISTTPVELVESFDEYTNLETYSFGLDTVFMSIESIIDQMWTVTQYTGKVSDAQNELRDLEDALTHESEYWIARNENGLEDVFGWDDCASGWLRGEELILERANENLRRVIYEAKKDIDAGTYDEADLYAYNVAKTALAFGENDLKYVRSVRDELPVDSDGDGLFDFENKTEPTPSLTNLEPSIEIAVGETRDLVFTLTNAGNDSDVGYLDLSVSSGIEIVANSSDASDMLNYTKAPGDSAFFSDGYEHPLTYSLFGAYKPYAEGESVTVTITIKATDAGEEWLKYRLSMMNSSGEYIRIPNAGVKDQQGWYAHETTVTVIDPANVAPAADAGCDQEVSEGTAVTLNGSGSSDSDGAVVEYLWREGGSVIGRGCVIGRTFSAGTHTVVLTITDDGGKSDSDTVAVTVAANAAPVADAGCDRSVASGAVVTLDGSGSSDSDGEIVYYEWQEGGAVLGSGDTLETVFAPGVHEITLYVVDDGGKVGSDVVRVEVTGGGGCGTLVNGTISTDTTWTVAGSPYIILDDGLTINDGKTLTLEPGVVVKFESANAGMYIRGTLNATGTTDNRIVFTSLKDDSYGGDTNGDGGATSPAPGDWGYLCFSGGSYVGGIGIFDHCILRYGGNYTYYPANVYSYESKSFSFKNSLSEYGKGSGVYSRYSNPVISNSMFNNNSIHGIHCTSASPNITGCTITGNQASGIYVTGTSTPYIRYTNMYNNSVYNIYNAQSSDIIAPNNWWGTTDPDAINSSIYDHYDNPSYGIVYYNPYLNAPASTTDTTPPTLTITSPVPNTTTHSPTITIAGTASDTSGIASVTVNGEPANGTLDWSANVTLSEGENTIPVVATDGEGLTTTKMVTVYRIESFTFVHITDVHIGYWPSDDIYDSEFLLSIERFTDTLQATKTHKPEFILSPGDLVEYSKEDFFNAYMGISKSLDIPLYNTPGNHDRRGWDPRDDVGLTTYDEIITNPGDIKPLNDGYRDYYFDKHGYRFIGLDSGADYNVSLPPFLKSSNVSTLASYDYLYDSSPEGDGLKEIQLTGLSEMDSEMPKIIFMHHPAVSDSDDESATWSFEPPVTNNCPPEYGGNDACIAFNRCGFIDYCINNNTDLVLTGHTHWDYVKTVFNELETHKTWFIQTRSATKDPDLYNYHGYRVIKITDKGIIPHMSEMTEDTLRSIERYTYSAPSNLLDHIRIYAYVISGSNVTGILPDDTVKREIPDSYYTGVLDELPQIIRCYNEKPDNFKFGLKLLPADTSDTTSQKAIEEASTNFNIIMKHQTENMTATYIYEDITFGTSENATAVVDLDPANVNYTMEIDYDGDGIIDDTTDPTHITINYAPEISITTPTGEERGNVTIPYNLKDAESDDCTIIAQYSLDNLIYLDADVGEGGDGMINLASAPDGVDHAFVWASGIDIPQTNATVYFRIRPYDGDLAGDYATTDAFSVANRGVRGDLNGDDRITPTDAAIALEIAAGSRPCDAAMLDAADVSGDGCVTSLDALMILQAAAGRIEL